MAEEKQTESAGDPTEIENARVGYQVAVDRWSHEGEQNWNRFNVLIAANSLVIGAIAVSLVAEKAQPVLAWGLAVVGFAISLVLWLVMERGFAFEEYYRYSAHELEEKYFRGVVETVSCGGRYAEGQAVLFTIDGQRRWDQIPCLGRMSTSCLLRIVIVVLALVYVAVFHSSLRIFPLTSTPAPSGG